MIMHVPLMNFRECQALEKLHTRPAQAVSKMASVQGTVPDREQLRGYPGHGSTGFTPTLSRSDPTHTMASQSACLWPYQAVPVLQTSGGENELDLRYSAMVSRAHSTSKNLCPMEPASLSQRHMHQLIQIVCRNDI